MPKVCPECGEKIVGRVDKKFCNDSCRNTFNNRLNKDSTNTIRKINNILRKNHRILEEFNPDQKATVTKQKLADKGFDFSYYTSMYTTKTGNVYYFVYDQGYLSIENNYLALVKRE